jgi:hypothetical protein
MIKKYILFFFIILLIFGIVIYNSFTKNQIETFNMSGIPNRYKKRLGNKNLNHIYDDEYSNDNSYEIDDSNIDIPVLDSTGIDNTGIELISDVTNI